ncbi:MAG: PEP-CTERM sorting domain-containing protein [Pseudomonadota bacterium]
MPRTLFAAALLSGVVAASSASAITTDTAPDAPVVDPIQAVEDLTVTLPPVLDYTFINIPTYTVYSYTAPPTYTFFQAVMTPTFTVTPFQFGGQSAAISAVPLPTTMALMGLALGGLAVARRKAA